MPNDEYIQYLKEYIYEQYGQTDTVELNIARQAWESEHY